MDGNRKLPVAKYLLTGALAAAMAPAYGQELLALSLEELLNIEIGVASRVSADPGRQPASVTIISREQIRSSGARTLNELLMLHVPGYFLVEDQDDTIAAVRGLTPDNNSKIMLLLDGRSLNADWFWGPPDALLNGLDLSYIERLEVIRGPGSVTLGQGALIGVVNIVTRPHARDAGHEWQATIGEHGHRAASWRWDWKGGTGRDAYVYAGAGRFDGVPLPERGLATQREQGLSVFERNHHLKRGDYRTVLVHLGTGRWQLDAFHAQQTRDLYGWRRDREVVQQHITGVELAYRAPLAQGEITVNAFHHIDDYALSTHGATRPEAGRSITPDLPMGGHRELRSGGRAQWGSGDRFERHRLVLGTELTRYSAGRANADGNNFIVNFQEDVLQRGLTALNAGNRWSLPGTITLRSAFIEDFVALGERWEGFAAARYDAHPNWGSQISPRLGVLFDADERQHWRLSLQRGYRGAVGVHYHGGFEGDGLLREENFTAVEQNPYFAANGDRNLRPVSPETLTSLELAWRFQWRPNVQLTAVAFRNTVRDVIGVGAYYLADPQNRAAAVAEGSQIGSDRIGDWGGVFFFQNNAGALTHHGLEVELEYRNPEAGLHLKASHALVRVGSADASLFGPGNIYLSGDPESPLSRSFPQDSTRLFVDWRPPSLAGRLRLTYTHLHYPGWIPPVTQSTTAPLPVPSLPGADLGNASIEWQFKRWPALRASVSLKNLWGADALYPATTVSGEESVGNIGLPAIEPRTAWLTLRSTF